jgi:predicted nucleic acid-binding protein
VAQEVARLVRADVVQLLGPIRQELLSGAQPDERFNQLKEYLRFCPNLPLDEEDDERAADYFNLCRRQGVQGTGTDLLICAVAVRHNLKVFSTDTDFESYSRCVPVKLYRVRPS